MRRVIFPVQNLPINYSEPNKLLYENKLKQLMNCNKVSIDLASLTKKPAFIMSKNK